MNNIGNLDSFGLGVDRSRGYGDDQHGNCAVPSSMVERASIDRYSSPAVYRVFMEELVT